MAESIRNGQTMDDAKAAAESAAARMAESGREALSQATSKAKDVLCNVESTVDKTLSGVGSRVNAAASTIRSNSPKFASSAADSVAGAMETGGEYLQEKGVTDIASDAKSLVKRYPVESMIIGFGAGLLLGRTLLRK